MTVALQQPAIAEAASRYIVKVGGIPETIYDHIEVVDPTAWCDIIMKGNLGIAESYMNGKMKVDPLPFFLTLLNGTSIGTRRKEGPDYLSVIMDIVTAPTMLAGRLINQQSKERSTRVTKQHYDAGNDLYEKMLGPTMSYTCAYWRNAKTLDQAQTNKFDLIRRKLQLEEGMKVADLGMGWGTAAAHMHKHGKVKVTGVSLSEEQVKWAQQNLARPGLDFVWQDYRDHCEDPAQVGTYDRVYSIGMLEHVGFKNHKSFFKCIKRLLKPNGLAVVHTIGEPDFVPSSDPFLDKYIFPGAVVPALSSLAPAIENDFILEDFQNFGYDYAKTLAAWSVNSKKFFKENPKAYTPEFQRMWDYYLKMSEALFELRINQLWHFVLSPRPATRSGIDRQT
uniref:Cyclopropane-fatty-acyl-phospholipid synthase n=1 Tax=Alexandrium andersonii TaxID=327968 RepID=A0A7S2IRX4_9DINO